ncbi:MAG: SMC family ATPase, partial [Acetobacteraceae bacterium]|nr:SMC family ATPase [Acetobacteraceae bacterium]
MRPLRLRFAAFCAYGGEQVLDFEESLGPHRLFLIHGPTGAGKTSVLDALCYALFGESSGEERAPAHLRSHHAAPDTRTEVELEFALGPERYRVLRRPAWERPKRRGSGTITEPGEAVLWRVRNGAATVVAEGERAVRPAVESLLGYSGAEFRQVVLLPQGRFRELLTAKPGERQQILNKLFHTALYRRIEKALAEQAKLAAAECKRLETLRAERLRQAGAESVEDAVVARADLAAALEAAEQRRAQAAEAARHARAAAETGRRQAELLARAAQAAAALSALEARLPEQAARRERLEAARGADRLRGAAAAWEG